MAYQQTRKAPDASQWLAHFTAMAEGEMDSAKKFFTLKNRGGHQDSNQQKAVKLIIPAAQTAVQAKAQIEQEEEEYRKQSSRQGARKPPSKRKRSVLLKGQDPDIFSD